MRGFDHATILSPWARSIQPKSQPVRPGKEDHLKRWTRFFETFPVGPNRSIEFWSEISGKFGWMDRAPCFYGLRKERLVQWPTFCVLNYDQKFQGVLPEKLGGGVCSTLPETLTLLHTKICDYKADFSFPSHRAPRSLFFFLPSPPTTQRGLCGGVTVKSVPIQ